MNEKLFVPLVSAVDCGLPVYLGTCPEFWCHGVLADSGNVAKDTLCWAVDIVTFLILVNSTSAKGAIMATGTSMAKMNCWEFKKCGREPRGVKASELGVCAAATEASVSGCNNGKNGGRACWAIAGTLCGGTVQGSFAEKLGNCLKCEFYKLVGTDEGLKFMNARDILAKIKN